MSDAAPRPSDAELLARFQASENAPPGSQTLGFRLLRVDQARMEVEAAFEGRREFCNPMGVIQGGFLTAMLDDAMSVAGLVASGMTHVMPTLEMKASFLRPAPPGELYVVGRVLKWGRTIAFTEGELYDGAAPSGQGERNGHADAVQAGLRLPATPRLA